MTTKHYIALERCADTDSILVLEHMNEEYKDYYDCNTVKDSCRLYRSEEELVRDTVALLKRKKMTIPILHKLKSILNRKSKADVVNKNKKHTEQKTKDTRFKMDTQTSLFNQNRVRVLVVKAESNIENQALFDDDDDDDDSTSSYESVSSLSMASVQKAHQNRIKPESDYDSYEVSAKKHKKNISHGTASSALSFDKSFLSIIASCFDHAEAIATCNRSQSDSSCSLEQSSGTYEEESESINQFNNVV